MKFIFPIIILGALFTGKLFAESAASQGGRGGPFVELHTASLSNFDSDVNGYPIILGGYGFGFTAKNFRLGGGGGGGFVWNPSNNVQFGLGFGGVVGEYVITSWLAARLLIGGGGYAVSKVLLETDTQKTEQKVNSGGFLLFQPSISAEVPIQSWIKIGGSVGYFLPNVSKLQSLSLSLMLIFGKV
jgi:hypothetical protein